MSPDNSIILVFEPRVILAGRTLEWSQFHQLGTCLIPQIVLEELEFLTNRVVYPEEEKTYKSKWKNLTKIERRTTSCLSTEINFSGE